MTPDIPRHDRKVSQEKSNERHQKFVSAMEKIMFIPKKKQIVRAQYGSNDLRMSRRKRQLNNDSSVINTSVVITTNAYIPNADLSDLLLL